MSKALIERAFEKWAEKHKTGVESKRDEVTAKTAFIAGATWQREQLEAEIKKLKTEIKTQKFINKESSKMIWEHRDVIKKLQSTREQLEAEIKELKDNQLCQCGDYHDKESLCSVCVMVKVSEAESKIQPAVDKAREQLIAELREAGEIIKDFCDESFDEHPDCKYQRAEQFLAKLDLLEGIK